MVKVLATSNIRFDGNRFAAGDVIDGLSDKQAEQLIKVGSAERTSANTPVSAGKKVDKKASDVKSRLLANKKTDAVRLTVAEKAQARNNKIDVKVDEQPDTDTENDAKAADTALDAADSDGFTNSGAAFSTKQTKSGQTKYYRDGKEIKKIDYLTAQQEVEIQ